MELQHFSHIHPLLFNVEPSKESGKAYCSGCGNPVSGANFSCVACGFYLDKKCAEAPSELALPFHHNHTLTLLANNPYDNESVCLCYFCASICENFVYHCPCKLDLHLRCALIAYNIAEKNIGELGIAPADPLISTETLSEILKKALCFACLKPLLGDPAYFSDLDPKFCMHRKCLELPLEIKHLSHHQHSLFLQFNTERLPCDICQETKHGGFVYCCSRCHFVLHIECVSSPLIFDDTRRHEHSFSRFFRRFPFMCDACGCLGKYVSYICSTCSNMVHEKCISLPHIIKSVWHHHPLSHKYFQVDDDFGTLECGICHEEVKMYGSYHCFECKFFVHVNCALQHGRSYEEIDEASKDAYEKLNEYQLLAVNDPSFFVIKEISLGESIVSTEIKHFSHEHNLVLISDEVKDVRYCDCCSLLIATSFYGCLQCNFLLHKSCVDLPKKKQIWHHFHQQPFNLLPHLIFQCAFCGHHCSGFTYRCEICRDYICVHCAKISSSWTSQGHEHLLLCYVGHTGECNACGGRILQGDNTLTFRCKGCNFNVHPSCTLLPQIAAHKCDEHLLKLTYHENNDYSKYHYCDICEKRRNPSIWFYNCAICNTSAHLHCVLGVYPFMKRGIKTFINSNHQHGLLVVKKAYDYPEACCKCGQPCLDLALECSETRCNYIIHWSCSALAQRFKKIFPPAVRP